MEILEFEIAGECCINGYVHFAGRNSSRPNITRAKLFAVKKVVNRKGDQHFTERRSHRIPHTPNNAETVVKNGASTTGRE
jgi:hypothetical protein